MIPQLPLFSLVRHELKTSSGRCQRPTSFPQQGEEETHTWNQRGTQCGAVRDGAEHPTHTFTLPSAFCPCQPDSIVTAVSHPLLFGWATAEEEVVMMSCYCCSHLAWCWERGIAGPHLSAPHSGVAQGRGQAGMSGATATLSAAPPLFLAPADFGE